MNQSVRTYWKRECKKMIPVMVLMFIFVVAIWCSVFYSLKGSYEETLLSLAFPETYSFEVGDVLLWNCWMFLRNFQWVFLIAIMLLMVARLFQYENRAGVSDFLTILPVSEKHKLAIKLVTGEIAIGFFAIAFGVGGSVVYGTCRSGLELRNQVIPGVVEDTNTLLVIWQMSLLFFVMMSAALLVLFLTQYIIHHFLLGLLCGCALLVFPIYFNMILSSFYEIPSTVLKAAYAWILPLCELEIFEVSSGLSSLTGYTGSVPGFTTKVIFWLVICVVVAVLLVVAQKKYWQVKEANNQVINSPIVEGFLLMGMAGSIGIGIAFSARKVPFTVAEYRQTWIQFMMTSLGVALGIVGIVYLIAYAIKKQRSKKEGI